jgi:HAD superfamily hydrolase (TIGR01662 family)
MIESIFFDLGDTLVSEETTVYDSSGQAVTARVIEGAFEVLEAIRKEGYKIGMIANGDSASIRNIIEATGLQGYFEVIVISEEMGIEKPYQRIFKVALDGLGVKPENSVMVGNRIDADILGANRAGMKSVWFRWNGRYDDTIDSSQEKPDFTINSLFELPGLLALIRQNK